MNNIPVFTVQCPRPPECPRPQCQQLSMPNDSWSVHSLPSFGKRIGVLQGFNHSSNSLFLLLCDDFKTKFFDRLPWLQECRLKSTHRLCDHFISIYLCLATEYALLKIFLEHFNLGRNDVIHPLLLAHSKQAAQITPDFRHRQVNSAGALQLECWLDGQVTDNLAELFRKFPKALITRLVYDVVDVLKVKREITTVPSQKNNVLLCHVSDARFVEDIRVPLRHVGHDDLRLGDPSHNLLHPCLRAEDVIGPQRFKIGILDRRLDRFVDRHELILEGHQNEPRPFARHGRALEEVLRVDRARLGHRAQDSTRAGGARTRARHRPNAPLA